MKFLKPKKYITLKEAARMSGYSADYLGQLIRQGKIYGKKVYLNVAWMTTEEEINRYLQQRKHQEINQKAKNRLREHYLRFSYKIKTLSFPPMHILVKSFIWSFVLVVFIFSWLFFMSSDKATSQIDNNLQVSFQDNKQVKIPFVP